jgi:hypothetical protein
MFLKHQGSSHEIKANKGAKKKAQFAQQIKHHRSTKTMNRDDPEMQHYGNKDREDSASHG